MRRSTRRAIGTTTCGMTGPSTPPARTAARNGNGRNPGTPGRQLGERVCADPQVLGADHPVDEADGEREPIRVAQQIGQARRGRIRRVRPRLRQPAPDQGDGLPREIVTAALGSRWHVGVGGELAHPGCPFSGCPFSGG